MEINSTEGSKNKMGKFNRESLLKILLICLSIAIPVLGFILGLQVFEALAEFRRLGIFIIMGSIIGAVMLLAMVKILNDLAHIKKMLKK